MFGKTISALTVVLYSAALLGQQAPATHAPAGSEFPAVMRQNVAAGKTPVGTKVEAKLAVATLVNGTVIPKDAVLSREVTESVAKSATDPSRLAIRIDSVQLKDGSAPLKLYLTPWYYPAPSITPQNLSYGPTDAEHTPRNWNGDGPYYDPKSPAYQPSPSRDKDKDPAPSSNPNHRLLMKNVECLRTGDGTVVITSRHSNIKLDKLTTYVLAPSDLLPMN
jgi:hypothetical protein